ELTRAYGSPPKVFPSVPGRSANPERGVTRLLSPTGESASCTELPRTPPHISRMTLPFQPDSRPIYPPPSGRHKALLHGVSTLRCCYHGRRWLSALPPYPPTCGRHTFRA